MFKIGIIVYFRACTVIIDYWVKYTFSPINTLVCLDPHFVMLVKIFNDILVPKIPKWGTKQNSTRKESIFKAKNILNHKFHILLHGV